MTWLRWDVETPRSDHLGHFAQELKIELSTALGHYFACVSGFGEHRRDGRIDDVSDTTLEQWAGWTGRKGTFAAVFRSRCRADGTGRDPAGTIRGWWRQNALLSKQEGDALKRKPPKNPPKTREGSSGVPPKNPRKTPGKPPENPRATVRNGTALKQYRENEDLCQGVVGDYLDGRPSAPEGRDRPRASVAP